MEKGKILKVRFGHEANCSAGAFLTMILYVSAATYLPMTLIVSGIQAHQVRKRGEISKNLKWVPHIVGILITLGLLIIAFSSSFGRVFLGLVAVVLGGVFSIAVFIGAKLAPKIGYWNMLVVPGIHVALGYALFWALMYLLF